MLRETKLPDLSSAYSSGGESLSPVSNSSLDASNPPSPVLDETVAGQFGVTGKPNWIFNGISWVGSCDTGSWTVCFGYDCLALCVYVCMYVQCRLPYNLTAL